MKPEKIDQRVIDCVKAKEESRRRAGRPPLPYDEMVEGCRHALKIQAQRAAWIAELIRQTRSATSQDLSDIDQAWIELEDFAACVHDGDDPHPFTLRLMADALLGARRDPNALPRLLGLVQQQGGTHAGNATQRLLWGRLLVRLEDEMGSGSGAMEAVQEACEYRYSESTLRKWRDDYRKWAEVSNGE